MRPTFVPELLHEPTGDPGLWVDVFGENRALLFDLGDLSVLTPRELMRVERAYVTHMHLDHWNGFDRLLRVVLGRHRELTVTGPAGFLEAVRGRIASYEWNVIDGYPVRVRAEEIDGDRIRSELYTGPSGMKPAPLPDRELGDALHTDRLFTVHVTKLDHGIPVLAFALREQEKLSVDPARLAALGLAPGAWLGDLKHAIRAGEPGDTRLDATTADGDTRPVEVAETAAEILRRSPGQAIAYATDFGATPENVAAVTDLARGADLLVCESSFLDEDRHLATERHHLTAKQAGEIARAAGVSRLAPFHVSPRYNDRVDALFDEAREAFDGPVLRLSRAERGRRTEGLVE